jgi:hypothetical protein
MASSLRSRFVSHIENNWIQNNHSLQDISCVYAIIGYGIFNKNKDIFYIGSTVRLNSRYKSHKVPAKIQDLGMINILYYMPMESGFYDYEIKLIKSLQPVFNKQHKNG